MLTGIKLEYQKLSLKLQNKRNNRKTLQLIQSIVGKALKAKAPSISAVCFVFVTIFITVVNFCGQRSIPIRL